LKGKRLVALDIGAMVAGSKYRGEFEDRLKAVLREITESNGEIVCFIDELHTLVGAGASQGAVDAANLLKPARARRQLARGAATPARIRMKIDSMPQSIDESQRRTMQLEIERVSVARDQDDAASRDRLARIDAELAQLKEKGDALKAQWQAEKEGIGRLGKVK